MFPENEVRKGQITMELKKLKETQERLAWPSHSDDLPVISWESCVSVFALPFPESLILRFRPRAIEETLPYPYLRIHSRRVVIPQ